MSKIKEDLRPLGAPTSWAKTPGQVITKEAALAGVDYEAYTMELKWGCGRLRLLVDATLREKFDRQRYLLNKAIWHGPITDVQKEAARMILAWQALDKAATAANKRYLSPDVWEVRLEDGTVAAITNGATYQTGVVADGRKMAIYSLEEVGLILSHYSEIHKAKITIPGVTVERVSNPYQNDPLDAFADSNFDFDDMLPNQTPYLGA